MEFKCQNILHIFQIIIALGDSLLPIAVHPFHPIGQNYAPLPPTLQEAPPTGRVKSSWPI
jgi:hypothetical protein